MIAAIYARKSIEEVRRRTMSSAKRLTPILLAACLLFTSATIDAAGATTLSVQIFTSNSIDDRSIPPGTPPTKLPAPLFTYTKQSDASILKVTYQDSAFNGSGVGPLVCMYQVRIDDTSSQPNDMFSAPLLVVSGGSVVLGAGSAGVFSGLTAGPHEISIWVSVNPTNVPIGCIQNFGTRTTTVIVEEVEPFIPTGK